MGLLKEATTNEQGAAKMAWYGPQGTGKTMSAVQVAIGLSHNFHKSAPIAFFDTEKGSDFARTICDQEGVKLFRVKSRAFSDLTETLKEAEQLGACCFIADSMTHVWNELMESFCRRKKIQRIEFQHWREIKGVWRDWVDLMLNTRLHVLICGRAGKEYEYQENDQGKKELVSAGTKFKAEGEFGYEPDVLVELWNEREEAKKRGSRIVHKALILKDRSWAINGREFAWKDRTEYKKGDYAHVYKCFAPYFDSLSIANGGGGAHHAIGSHTSDGMFDENGDAGFQKELKLRQMAIEDWDTTMSLIWPGQTADQKHARAVIGEAITGVRSRTKLETFRSSALREFVQLLMALEKRLKVEPVNNVDELLAQLEMAKEDMLAPKESKTLVQVMLEKSVEQVNGDKKRMQEEKAEALQMMAEAGGKQDGVRVADEELAPVE